MSTHASAATASRDTRTVLIAGAGFAGLAAAWWMHRLGYAVTVVEVAAGLKKGGTPVDIREGVIEVVQRMGLLDRIVAHSLPPRSMQFLNEHGQTIVARSADQDTRGGHEIERDVLLELLYGDVRHDVEFLFGDSIAALDQDDNEVNVLFTSGQQRSFSLVLGCDGTHSTVRRLCFGDESRFSLFLKNYFSLTIVSKLLIEENSCQMFNLPGSAVMLTAYQGKTDIGFAFFSEGEISYDRRDRDAQKRVVQQHFKDCGWRVPELLEEMHRCPDFYFDKLCQIRMSPWAQGRVALVGDAAYCPSPAAGMGGSMAILGAAAFADALASHPEDLGRAVKAYQSNFGPVAEEIQHGAVAFGLPLFLPATVEQLRERNQQLGAVAG